MTIETSTLPNGAYGGYNLGNNLVHEAGHWMGLSHPFTGGCSEPNDGVDDTAEQVNPRGPACLLLIVHGAFILERFGFAMGYTSGNLRQMHTVSQSLQPSS